MDAREIAEMERVMAERDQLRATVTRVLDLANQWDRWPNGEGHVNQPKWFAGLLRQAIKSRDRTP